MVSIGNDHDAAEQSVRNSIERFERWLDRHGYAGHDPYDLWGTGYGVFSRRLFYCNKYLGLGFIAPILLMDYLIPSARCIFTRKERFATADAQLVMAFLNLYRLTHDERYLTKSLNLAEELLSYSIPGYSGYCWGYPFDWEHSSGFWKKNTPYITATPYCFEAFFDLFDSTGNSRYLDIAASVARFVAMDLNDTPTSATASAGSYSPLDESKVVNASAYRAMVLLEASSRFDDQSYRDKGTRNLNFILENQNNDGSWLYAIDLAKNAFIDHFHTCFVLKNLYKINRRLKSVRVGEALQSGWNFYSRNLFYDDGTPRSFAIEPRRQIVAVDMYNYAEAITLGSLLRKEIPEAYEHAEKLAMQLIESFQLPDGHFVTKVFIGGFRHTFPFLRWSQAQLFYALTNFLHTNNQP